VDDDHALPGPEQPATPLAGQASQLVNDFYVPVLGAATRYDRQAGYFDSSSLVQVASGLAAFIRRLRMKALPDAGPAMRLITGATLSEDDRAASEVGGSWEGEVGDIAVSPAGPRRRSLAFSPLSRFRTSRNARHAADRTRHPGPLLLRRPEPAGGAASLKSSTTPPATAPGRACRGRGLRASPCAGSAFA
jgi:hypothetical protein